MENSKENPAPEFKEFLDSRIIQIIDETIQKLRDILDQVEGLVHEVWDIVQIIAAMIQEAKKMFQSSTERAAA